MSSEHDHDYSYEPFITGSLDLFNTSTEKSAAESASFGPPGDQSIGDNLFDFDFSIGLAGASTLNSFANGFAEENLQSPVNTGHCGQSEFTQADGTSSSPYSYPVAPTQHSAFNTGSFARHLGPADATINPGALDISGREFNQYQQDSKIYASSNPPGQQ
jgi:hypothetical protein